MSEVSKEYFELYIKRHHLKESMLPFGCGFSYEDKSGFQKAYTDGRKYFVMEE